MGTMAWRGHGLGKVVVLKERNEKERENIQNVKGGLNLWEDDFTFWIIFFLIINLQILEKKVVRLS